MENSTKSFLFCASFIPKEENSNYITTENGEPILTEDGEMIETEDEQNEP